MLLDGEQHGFVVCISGVVKNLEDGAASEGQRNCFISPNSKKKKIKNGHRRPPHVVSFRFCMGRSLYYALLNFLIKFVKQRAREELAEGHIKPITKLFNGSTSKVRSVRFRL